MKKTIIWAISLLFVLAILFYIFLYAKLEIIAGYNAKILCSCIFVSGIDQETAEKVDLGFGPLWLASNKVDLYKKAVYSNVLGMHPKQARYREGLGCALVNSSDVQIVDSQTLTAIPGNLGPDIWGKEMVKGTKKLIDILQQAFDTAGSNALQTRAVIVIKNGEIVGESYAQGIDQNSKLLGWSMAKSITSALAGILVKAGHWGLDDPLNLPEWQGDDRKNITLRHVLQMTTGLSWEEEYGSVSTATKMLYSNNSMGAYAASMKSAYTPGEYWQYSSGTSNMLAMAMGSAFQSQKDYWSFPHEKLFGPLGISNFVMETDASGHFVGSSYAYGTARDWAKLGQLYLQEGNWNGEQILDSSWVSFSHEPVKASEGKYGAHFWLNADGRMSFFGASDYWMDGFQGQSVLISPDDQLVIVRLGVTYDEEDFDFNTWVGKIKEAVKD